MKRVNSVKIGEVFYVTAAIFTVALFIITMLIEKNDEGAREFKDWYSDEALTAPAVIKPPKLNDGRCEFYARIPDSVKAGDCLWFKCKNAVVSVSVGGEQRAELEKGNYPELYGKTVGTGVRAA